MLISRISLKNWRNFQRVDVAVGNRVFLVGPNASGKSNLLDAIRFLRELSQDGGGLQKAVELRGGLSKIRCLSARKDPEVEIEVDLSTSVGARPTWKYSIGIRQQSRGSRAAYLSHERVSKDDQLLLDRPDDDDRKDQLRLTQTHLEQISANMSFREVASFLELVQYLHLVPQLVRHSDSFSGPGVPGDPFGLHFLEKLSLTPEKTRQSRLNKIQAALKIAVPHLEGLSYVQDKLGTAHLEARYEHWRPDAGIQREDQFSDGTLRLIGLLWSLLDGSSPLLLEEPELSLHAGIVRALPGLMYRLVGKKRQIIITTHSADLLRDEGIGPAETFILVPGKEGTSVQPCSEIAEVEELLKAGMSMADAVIPRTRPGSIEQLSLFQ